MYMGFVFKAVYLVAQFFLFKNFKSSFVVPHVAASDSPLHQLARHDVFFAPPGLHILIIWSKTLQAKNVVKILKLPVLASSPFCPVAAVKTLLSLSPGNSDRYQVMKKLKKNQFFKN